MPNRQRPCAAHLRNWKQQFFKIKNTAVKVQAVNTLIDLAVEMRGFWPDTRVTRTHWPADLQAVKDLRLPEPEKIPKPAPVLGEIVTMDMLIAAEPAAEPVVNISGTVEGVNIIETVPVVTFPALPVQADEVEVLVHSYCPNPRLLAGKDPAGKVVSVWKGSRAWRLPQKIICRRDPGQQILTPI